MSANSSFIARSFTELLSKFPDADWDAELVEKVGKIINVRQPDPDLFDNAMQTITKLVESKLREAVSKFIGGKISSDKDYGMKLVDFAKKVDFIKGSERRKGKEPEPLYFLLRWYFSEPRSQSHHIFKSYPISMFLNYLVITNHILKEIEIRARGPRLLHIPITFDKSEYVVGEPINVKVQVVKMDGTPITEGQVSLHAILPPGIERDYDLSHGGSGYWVGQIPTKDVYYGGTVPVTVNAIDSSGEYSARSGSGIWIKQLIEGST